LTVPRLAGMSASAAAPLRRDPTRGVLAGVAAGIARRLGIDPLIVRVGFIAASAAGGLGLALYLLAWVLMPGERGERAPVERIAGRRETWLVVAGMMLLALAALLLLRRWGIWFSDAIVWPVILAAAGGALIWRQSTDDEPAADREMRAAPRASSISLPRDATGRVFVGAALVVGGGLVFLWLNDALQPARDVLLAVVVVVVALTLILAPWWLRLVRGLTAERTERIRSQERAEVAAHLHDSVLQTLALMQKRVDDPREVAALARRQERELRAWLNGRRAAGEETVALALESAAAEVEEAHGVPIEVVAVGDAPLDERARALVAAAREAMVNAAKFAGPAALYAEVEPERIEVFVRDRGPGFDPAAVPDDRRGVSESIVGRMERHGGRAVVHTAPGEGTEIELVMTR
jgi:signal transduction histidine kinase